MPTGSTIFIHQHWVRKKDRKVFIVRQVWRKDKTAQLESIEDDGEVLVTAFRELSTKWKQVVFA